MIDDVNGESSEEKLLHSDNVKIGKSNIKEAISKIEEEDSQSNSAS